MGYDGFAPSLSLFLTFQNNLTVYTLTPYMSEPTILLHFSVFSTHTPVCNWPNSGAVSWSSF